MPRGHALLTRAPTLHCPACRATLRYAGVARLSWIAGLAYAPWLLAAVLLRPDGLAELAFGLSLLIPTALVAWQVPRRLSLVLRDPAELHRPHFHVRPGPRPEPPLPSALEWLRVVAPARIPLLDAGRRAVLRYVVPAALLTMLASCVTVLASSDPVLQAQSIAVGLAALLAFGGCLALAGGALGVVLLLDRLRGRLPRSPGLRWSACLAAAIGLALALLPAWALAATQVWPMIAALWAWQPG